MNIILFTELKQFLLHSAETPKPGTAKSASSKFPLLLGKICFGKWKTEKLLLATKNYSAH